MRKILFILSFSLILNTLQAQDIEERYIGANNLYSEGKYDTALIVYKGIEAEGWESSSLYLNIGNTYYKTHEYALAILNYEKALKLDPSNEEARQNLDVVGLHKIDKIEPMPELFLTRWWKSIVNMYGAKEWTTFSIVSYSLLLLFIVLFLCSRTRSLRKIMFFASLLMLVVSFIVFRASHSRNEYLSSRDEAIITTTTTTVKSAPSEESTDLFVLHEGTKVEVVEANGEWLKIKIANGSNGWLLQDDMIRF